eukprot:9991109-Alexandrium_andersonii.AAC.1
MPHGTDAPCDFFQADPVPLIGVQEVLRCILVRREDGASLPAPTRPHHCGEGFVTLVMPSLVEDFPTL